MRKPVIVLVDDEMIILLALKKELQNHFGPRFSYEVATSATEADELVDQLEGRGLEVALVICDWLMPGMKGDEFLIALHRRKPSIQAIIVTGHADPASIERAMQDAGLHACLSKPWKKQELFEAVEACTPASSGQDSEPDGRAS